MVIGGRIAVFQEGFFREAVSFVKGAAAYLFECIVVVVYIILVEDSQDTFQFKEKSIEIN